MGAIDLFDGHCDTVFQCLHGGGGFARNHCHLDLERAGTYRRYAQFFALYGQPEDFAGTALEGITHQEIFRRGAALFQREMEANAEKIIHCRSGGEANRAFSAGKAAAFLSVEGAELLGCSLEGLEQARDLGVRAVTLTWNHANALSGTNCEQRERGLSSQGKAFVRRAEELGVLVDVSHLSDPGFWDVAETLSGPFLASHSNSRQVFSHERNLTDGQFTAIIDHGGVAGLNLYAEFIGSGRDLEAAIAHLEHWLELGGERHISLGGDLDGCSALIAGISGIQDYRRLYEALLRRGHGEALVRDLFFNNLMRVVSEVCTM